jgi:hypothetical protein
MNDYNLITGVGALRHKLFQKVASSSFDYAEYDYNGPH